MTFDKISSTKQDVILQLLNNHLNMSAANLESDKCILPMLMTTGVKPMLVGLQPKSGKTDVDVALSVAIEHLKNTDFEHAIFSYSTTIGLSDGKQTSALKSFIIDKSGMAVVFFTPFSLQGFFKKKVTYEKSIIGEVVESIFQ